jgi:hypothetical protein
MNAIILKNMFEQFQVLYNAIFEPVLEREGEYG